MSRRTAHTIVPFTPEQMYALVVDMDRYSEFLPWCAMARKYDVEETCFKSEMTFTFKGLRETFYTLDRIEPGHKITITNVSGPFQHLESEWLFTPVAEGTKINFFIDFRFKSKILDMTVGPLFAEASRRMVDAFTKRALAIYGSQV